MGDTFSLRMWTEIVSNPSKEARQWLTGMEKGPMLHSRSLSSSVLPRHKL